MVMVTVSEAEAIIGAHIIDYGVETVCVDNALGRVLAEALRTDRDLPPFNRATVDGIAIQTAAVREGMVCFTVQGIQAAGVPPLKVFSKEHCVEIMTGAAVDDFFDAVIRYEDCVIENGRATLIPDLAVKPGMNIHFRGMDKLQGAVLADKKRMVTPALTGVAASIGKTTLLVKKFPKIVVISTGDEMVAVTEQPTAYQLRRSNGLVIKSCLDKYKIRPDLLHINDDPAALHTALSQCLQEYDVLLMTGGVSMGKFDFVPDVLSDLGVEQQFHKVKQRPGKPFWFGRYLCGQKEQQEAGKAHAKLIFAFPGNPVAVFMCMNRYFIPWLRASLGLAAEDYVYAVLTRDVYFKPALQYFAQVSLQVNREGVMEATPFTTNGSGDFSNLIYTNGFMELPVGGEDGLFKKGESYKVWRY